MSHLIIEDVRKGLDTRRSALSSPDGTLTEALDAHITPGGNFEKRKAFVPATLPTGTFGLQPIPAGLLVFGSGVDPGGFPSDADGNVVTYQRLQHPAVILGETYSAGSHAMTAVVHSEAYGGQAFVIAQFADGKRYCYYAGSLVRDFTDGLVLAGRTTLPEVAADFAAMVNRNGLYTAVQQANPNDDKVAVTSANGTEYNGVVNKTSTLGTLAFSKTTNPVPGIAGNAARGSFQVVAGSYVAGTNKISKVEVGPVGGTLVTITSAAVNWQTSNAATAAALASNITAFVGTGGYTATAIGNTVTLYAAESMGDTPNDHEVRVTAAGNVCIGAYAFQFVGTAFTVASITVNGTNILTALTPAFPSPNATLSAEVTAIVANINANTGTNGGYVAYGNGALLYLSKAVTSSRDSPLSVAVNFTGAASGSGGTIIDPVTQEPTPMAVSIRSGIGYNNPSVQNFWVRVYPFYGIPPYHYVFSANPGILWVIQGAQVGNNVPDSQAEFACIVNGLSPGNFLTTATCVVTDSKLPTPNVVTISTVILKL